MSGQTREQQRAKHALAAIKAIISDETIASDYRQRIRGMPALVVTCGLGQAMAMARSKTDERAAQMLYDHMKIWLCQSCPNSPLINMGGGDLLEAICAVDQRAYVWAQAEAIRYMHWLKTFAAALIPAPASGDRR